MAESAIDSNLERIESLFSGQGSSQSSRRLMQEYRNLLSSKTLQNISVEFEHGSNIYIWHIHIDTTFFDLGPSLASDFETYARRYSRPKTVVFEVRFPNTYPADPPFVRLIRPRIQFRTGHVTIGGSICVEGLTRQGWINTRTVENVLVEVLTNIPLGGGRLDIQGSGYDYQLAEAMDAFERMLRVHGWRR
jgi:ubiquitin-conjugating enzyme E2 Q